MNEYGVVVNMYCGYLQMTFLTIWLPYCWDYSELGE